MTHYFQHILAVLTLWITTIGGTAPAVSLPPSLPSRTSSLTLTAYQDPITLTAYSCERTPTNPMNAPGMCVTTAYGADPQTVGVACPPEWRGTRLLIEGYEAYGVLECDDTGKHPVWLGLLHLDVRVSTEQEARHIGVRTVTVWIVESPQ